MQVREIAKFVRNQNNVFDGTEISKFPFWVLIKVYFQSPMLFAILEAAYSNIGDIGENEEMKKEKCEVLRMPSASGKE